MSHWTEKGGVENVFAKWRNKFGFDFVLFLVLRYYKLKCLTVSAYLHVNPASAWGEFKLQKCRGNHGERIEREREKKRISGWE